MQQCNVMNQKLGILRVDMDGGDLDFLAFSPLIRAYPDRIRHSSADTMCGRQDPLTSDQRAGAVTKVNLPGKSIGFGWLAADNAGDEAREVA